MNILELCPELINIISGFLPLNDCLLWKLTCRYYNNLLSGFDDLFQARYLYKLGEKIDKDPKKADNPIYYDKKLCELLDEMIGELVKGREYIAANNPNWFSHSVFIYYLRKGDLYWVNRMLADVDPSQVRTRKDKHNAIDLACYHGHLDIVNRLLEDPRVDPSYGDCSALYLAAICHLNVVDRLLEDPRIDLSIMKGFFVNIISTGNIDVINRFLEYPNIDPSDNKNAAIGLASFYGYLDIMDRLMEDPRVDPSDNNNDAIKTVAEYGNIDAFNKLLEDPRVDPSVNNNYTIRVSSHIGSYKKISRLMKDPRVDPSDNNNEAIRTAYGKGFYNIVEILMKDWRVIDGLTEEDKRMYWEAVNLLY